MAQYGSHIDGSVVDVTKESAIVSGTQTRFVTQGLAAGMRFKVVGQTAWYQIASVDSESQLTLTSNYVGPSRTGTQYTVHTQTSPNFGWLLPAAQDRDKAEVIAEALSQADKSLAERGGEWIDFGDTPTQTSATSFTLPGDETAEYHVGRRLRATDSSTLYGVITASSYDGGTDKTTVTVSFGSGSLSSSLSAVAVGVLSVTDPSVPALANAVALRGLTTGGVLHDLVRVDAADRVVVGDAGLPTDILGSAVTINGGVPLTDSIDNSDWSGADLAVANGGTGASSASAARANLGAQAQDADLDALAALSTTGLVNRTGAGAVSTLQVNLAATAAPAATDDADAGYSVGSRWIDTTNDREYVCLDATAGAAVWTETTGGGGAVTSVFGRTGDVVAAAGDYTAAQVTGALDAANNLADVQDAAAALANLGGQPQDADLDALAALATTGLVNRTGAGAAATLQLNLAATAAPGASDDSGAGYTVGSRWIDVSNDKEYVCLDATAGAAIWAETTATSGGGGGVTGPAGSTDNAVARWDGTAGDTLRNSGVTISDTDDLDIPGALTLGTALAVTEGGTGAADAATALANLGGQPADADLDALAGLTTTGYVNRTGAGAAVTVQLNHAATAAPAATDDSGAGYSVGSRWIDTTNDREYVCVDATGGAAVWIETTQPGGGDVTGPAGSTDNALVRWNGTAGDTVQDSGWTLGDGGVLTAAGDLAMAESRVSAAELVDVREPVHALGDQSGSITIPFDQGGIVTMNLVGDITGISFSGATASKQHAIVLRVTNGASFAWPAAPAGIKTPAGAALGTLFTSTSTNEDECVLQTPDDATTVFWAKGPQDYQAAA